MYEERYINTLPSACVRIQWMRNNMQSVDTKRHRARSGIREAFDENKEDAVINYGPKGGGIRLAQGDLTLNTEEYVHIEKCFPFND